MPLGMSQEKNEIFLGIPVNTKCHSERSEESRVHKVGVTEILPPCGRLNDITGVSTSI